jgi:hypothetical protein
VQNDKDELMTGSQWFPQLRSPVQRRRPEASSRLRACAGPAEGAGESVWGRMSVPCSCRVPQVWSRPSKLRQGSGQWGRDSGMGEHVHACSSRK